jgi:5-methyltetrahydrofolate--homocysteine methyltransferase
METRLKSRTREVIISSDRSTVLIGERINPTGKKELTEAIKMGNLDILVKEAADQVNAGADVLDINVGVLDIDEVSLLPKAVQKIMDAVDVPLCIDSTNPLALEAALKIYKGKPLINSVTGQDSSLKSILPLVKKYNTSVIGLTMDDNGIPENADKRVSIARKIIEHAESIGISRNDVIIDCLALAVGANTRAGLVIIESISRIKYELGVNLTLGVSNISFGLPGRSLLNTVFLTIAIAMGVNCPIVDVGKVRREVLAADLILDRDKYARRYVRTIQKQ